MTHEAQITEQGLSHLLRFFLLSNLLIPISKFCMRAYFYYRYLIGFSYRYRAIDTDTYTYRGV